MDSTTYPLKFQPRLLCFVLVGYSVIQEIEELAMHLVTTPQNERKPILPFHARRLRCERVLCAHSASRPQGEGGPAVPTRSQSAQ